MQVSRWRDGLAVELPTEVVEALALKEGDEVEFHVSGDGTVRLTRQQRNEPAPKRSREDFMRELRTFRGLLPADFKFDRDEANAR